MSKNVKPGGDKVIKFLRMIGDIGENVVSVLVTSTVIVGGVTLLARGLTDLKVISNKRKMKGGSKS